MKRDRQYGIVSRYWWIPLLTGLASIALGIWCLCDPSGSIPVLAYVFTACMIVAGCMNIGFAFSSSRVYGGWGWSLALGLMELLCGIWLWCLPMPALAVAFMYIIGVWILVVAINGICESFMMSAVSPLWIIWAVLLLLATVVFAIIFLTNPILSGLTEWIWLGISLLTYGAFRITLAFRIKNLKNISGGIL